MGERIRVILLCGTNTTCEVYSVFWIWTCISCKCILQTPGKPLNTNNNMKEEEEWEEEEEKYNQYAKKGEKWEA